MNKIDLLIIIIRIVGAKEQLINIQMIGGITFLMIAVELWRMAGLRLKRLNGINGVNY